LPKPRILTAQDPLPFAVIAMIKEKRYKYIFYDRNFIQCLGVVHILHQAFGGGCGDEGREMMVH
jgi:hypothetical protein